MIPRIVFCPRCHAKIIVPAFATQIQTEKGITMECRCGGKIKIKTKWQPDFG